ncbi:MAG: hypothetical protein IK117_09435 [Bacteroidales bacterium]|nr:hypothetical protein [Bacteroidales bacterium]
MKKLKFLALGLVAAFGFAACGPEDEVQEGKSGATYTESTIVMGGAKSSNGSFYTFDKGVQTKTQLGDVATNVVFCFQTLNDNFRFISGTIADNEIVKAQATETKFIMIGDAKATKFEKADFAADGKTSIDISNKLEAGKKAVAFKNAKCEGFFEIVSYDADAENLTINIWTKDEAK